MAELKLDSPLQYVKGVGPRKAEMLASAGMHVVGDLLMYFPRQYLDRTSVSTVGSLQIDQNVTIIGKVMAHGILHGRKRRYEVILQDETGAIALLFFHQVRYWERLFKKNQLFAATGTVGHYQGLQMIHPELERLEDETDRMIHAGRIVPVYPQTAELSKVGLGSRGIRKITTYIFDNLTEQIDDYLSEEELVRQKLLPLHEAIREIHYPQNREQVERCRRRLAFDELLAIQYVVLSNRQQKAKLVKNHTYNPPGELMKKFKQKLAFELTSGQKRVTREIFDDLRQRSPMNRLLQGDVGCGKTVVAIAASVFVTENDLQTAFMAPTEILAEQHFRNWQTTLEEIGVSTAILTSSLKPAQKKKIVDLCAGGEIDLLFGTHALIYDYVSFDRLGLVVIDEQHRFGVEQRSRLYAKGDNPDLLVMTATPIPRTLAMTIYGDLDFSTIDTLPPGRKPVRTVWRPHDVSDKVYEFVRDEVKKGGQAYIVYPLIEKSEQLELANVEDAYKELTAGPLNGCRVGIVHGRTKQKERDEVLGKFNSGELDILMATTVIEVGIDNPRATMMVIEHAERFGLAQLHQLRGRIGRGKTQSTLIALAYPPLSDIARRRLSVFTDTVDGFRIAEADLELRGPGEIHGLRQSGLPQLRAARLGEDNDLLQAARILIERIFSESGKLDDDILKLYNYLEENKAALASFPGGG